MKSQPIFFLLAFFTLLSACGAKPLAGDDLQYVGTWSSRDGSMIQIFENGKANMEYRSGGANTSVQGGPVTIQSNTLEIRLFGIGQTFQIDQKPTERDGRVFMALDGIEYYRRQ